MTVPGFKICCDSGRTGVGEGFSGYLVFVGETELLVEASTKISSQGLQSSKHPILRPWS